MKYIVLLLCNAFILSCYAQEGDGNKRFLHDEKLKKDIYVVPDIKAQYENDKNEDYLFIKYLYDSIDMSPKQVVNIFCDADIYRITFRIVIDADGSVIAFEQLRRNIEIEEDSSLTELIKRLKVMAFKSKRWIPAKYKGENVAFSKHVVIRRPNVGEQ